MITHRSASIFAAIGLFIAGVHTVLAEPSGVALKFIRAGQYRMAAERLRAELDDDPDDFELLTRLGMVYAQMGHVDDAWLAFQFGQGSPHYEQRALGAHASVSRELGYHQQAAELRLAQILNATAEGAQVSAYLAAAEDHLAYGDDEAALDMALNALGLRPESTTVHAWLADIHHHRGDRDQAEFHLWMAEREGIVVLRACEVRARIAMEDDALIEARDHLVRGRDQRSRGARLATQLSEVYRRMGWLQDAAWSLGRTRILYGERHDYLLTLARVERDLGNQERACLLSQRAHTLYPHRDDASGLAAQMGCPVSAEGVR